MIAPVTYVCRCLFIAEVALFGISGLGVLLEIDFLLESWSVLSRAFYLVVFLTYVLSIYILIVTRDEYQIGENLKRLSMIVLIVILGPLSVIYAFGFRKPKLPWLNWWGWAK